MIFNHLSVEFTYAFGQHHNTTLFETVPTVSKYKTSTTGNLQGFYKRF